MARRRADLAYRRREARASRWGARSRDLTAQRPFDESPQQSDAGAYSAGDSALASGAARRRGRSVRLSRTERHYSPGRTRRTSLAWWPTIRPRDHARHPRLHHRRTSVQQRIARASCRVATMASCWPTEKARSATGTPRSRLPLGLRLGGGAYLTSRPSARRQPICAAAAARGRRDCRHAGQGGRHRRAHSGGAGFRGARASWRPR